MYDTLYVSNMQRTAILALAVKETNIMEEHESYHEGITGAEAERRLKRLRMNSYLTRYSKKRKTYVLTVYKLQAPEDVITHFKIDIKNGKYNINGKTKTFNDIRKLLEYYERNRLDPAVSTIGEKHTLKDFYQREKEEKEESERKREREERAQREREEREQREREKREQREKEEREREEREQREEEEREQREREQREQREREKREQREKEEREREEEREEREREREERDQQERDQQERDQQERDQQERDQQERERRNREKQKCIIL